MDRNSKLDEMQADKIVLIDKYNDIVEKYNTLLNESKELIDINDGLDNSIEELSELYSKLNKSYNELLNKNNTIEVPVDNGKLDMVIEFIEDHEDMDFSKLVSDDYSIIEAMEFYKLVEAKAENRIEEKFKDILDDEDKFDTDLASFRESEVSLREIEDTKVISIDYEDKDAELEVIFKVRAKESGEASSYFTYNATVLIDNGSIDDVFLN